MSVNDDQAGTDDGRESVDDQFRSLLEGLRTSLPGVQVLFAFLLITPLQRGFDDLSLVERVAYGVAFYASAVASVLLIAPSVHQRVRAPVSGLRRHSKRHLIVTTWVTIVGTIAMGVAIIATVLLVSSLAFAGATFQIATALVAALTVWAWFALPLITFRHDGDERDD